MHARIGQEKTQIRDDSKQFVDFSLMNGIKSSNPCLEGISSNMNVPRKAAVVLAIQFECQK